jgi:hypothetical protein
MTTPATVIVQFSPSHRRALSLRESLFRVFSKFEVANPGLHRHRAPHCIQRTISAFKCIHSTLDLTNDHFQCVQFSPSHRRALSLRESLFRVFSKFEVANLTGPNPYSGWAAPPQSATLHTTNNKCIQVHSFNSGSNE